VKQSILHIIFEVFLKSVTICDCCRRVLNSPSSAIDDTEARDYVSILIRNHYVMSAVHGGKRVAGEGRTNNFLRKNQSLRPDASDFRSLHAKDSLFHAMEK